MDASKLKSTVMAAESALDRLQQALDRKDQAAINAALVALKGELQTIKSMAEPDAINIPALSASGKKYVGWRVLHKSEGGYDKTPLGMPEVIPPENPAAIEMTEDIQRLSFDLMIHFNPAITRSLWTKVHNHDIAFTNFQGFAKPGDPRANYILGDNLDKELPKYDKAQRLCGGMFVRGIVRGDKLVCQPGIHGIDSTKPLPSIQTIVDNNWYFYALSYHAKRVEHFPQGKGGPVVIPFIFDREIAFPLSLFVKWEEDTLPDPLKIYK